MIQRIIAALLAALSLLLAPPAEAWEPDETDVVALAQCLEGECGGCSVIQQQAVCCVVFNRVDSHDFPDTLLGVITAPKQFHGYSPDNPVRDDLYELSYQEIVRWHNGEAGVIGHEYLFFWGDGRRNHFTTAYHGGKEWCEG